MYACKAFFRIITKQYVTTHKPSHWLIMKLMLKSFKEVCRDLSSAMILLFIFPCPLEVGITSKSASPIVTLACKVNFDLL